MNQATRIRKTYEAAVTADEFQCPRCEAVEVNSQTNLLQIRAFKVSDKNGCWSQCLICKDMGHRETWFNEVGDLVV